MSINLDFMVGIEKKYMYILKEEVFVNIFSVLIYPTGSYLLVLGF